MQTTLEKTIGEMVAEDYRTALVFKKYNIDFCCNGNRTIAEACDKKKNVDETQVRKELDEIKNNNGNSSISDYNSWPLDLLADYIEKKHHRYVEERSLQIKPLLDKLCKVHGDRHPELFEVYKEFQESTMELAAHMKKEEFIIFPFVRKMVANGDVTNPSFGTVQNPINMMMDDHNAEGERFRKISDLTDAYNPPADACNTYRVTYALLKEFEDDLHLHIHLENNILFPKAIEMEKTL